MNATPQNRPTHSPLLVNAALHPWPDSQPLSEIERASLHDGLRVAMISKSGFAEYCWLELVMRSHSYWVGIVRSKMDLISGIAPGDLVRFHPINVYRIHKFDR